MRRTRRSSVVLFVVLTFVSISMLYGIALAGEVFTPSAPQNVRAFPDNASALVAWDPPASNGGSPITSYTVIPSPDDAPAVTVSGSTTETTVPGLTNGTSYTFDVFATNDSGDGPTATSNAVTPTAESNVVIINGAQGAIVTTKDAGTGDVGKVIAPSGGPAEVIVSLVLTTGSTSTAGALTTSSECPSAMCLDVNLDPADAYGPDNALKIVLKVLRDGFDRRTRPIYKDDVLIPKCVTRDPISPDPCVKVRENLNEKFQRFVILASSTDPKYRT